MSVTSPKRRQLLGAAVLGTLPSLAAGAHGGILRIVTSELPPLAMEQGERPGALRELVNELCRRLRLVPEISFVPWKRAQFMTTHMNATAIFPLTRLPEREAQFRWLAPLYEERYAFLAPRGRGFDVRRPQLMKAKRITMIRGSGLIAVLREMGYRNVIEARSVDEVHRFLQSAIADASFGETAIIRNSLRTRGQESDFDVGEPVSRTVAWLAGSLDFSAADAALYQKTMREMTADGSATRILKSYGLA
jgi:polar amino acid transport system substrate-binding protein